MTNEEKQALIEWAHKWIVPAKRIAESNPSDKSAQASLKLYEVALAALTAQPVKLPNKIERDDIDGYWMHKSGRVSAVNAAYFNEALSECKEALKAQGYEVQE